MRSSLQTHQRGASMIEVLITVLVLSTALLGLAILQTRALQYNQGAYFRSQANILAFDILDRMRLYTSADGVWVGGAAGLPAIGDGVKAVEAWQQQIAASLPDGKSTLNCVMSTRVCTVNIEWTNLNSSGEKSEDKSTFTYTAKL